MKNNSASQNRVPTQELKPERVQAGFIQELKPERVQAGLVQEPGSEGVHLVVDGQTVDNDNVVFIVNGRKLKPERVQAGITFFDFSKLKPERVQAGFAMIADAVRYLRRLRLKKAAMAFREGMKILEQEARSFARSFGISIHFMTGNAEA